MQFQVTLTTPKGGVIIVGTSAANNDAVERSLARIPFPYGTEVTDVTAIPPRSER